MSLLEQELCQTRPIDDPATEAILSVLKSGDVIERALEATVHEHNLTLQQYHVLRILRGAGPKGMPVLAIADQMIEGHSNVTRLLDRLVAKGLAERCPAPHDRRVVLARLTPTGDERLGHIQAPVHHAQRAICGALTSGEIDHLTRLLEKLRRGVYARRPS